MKKKWEEKQGERMWEEVSSEPCKPTTSICGPTHSVRGRTRVVPIRFTPEERKEIGMSARAFHLSLSEYVRRAVLKRRLPPLPAPEINRSAYQELARVGNNLNQLTKAIHSGQASCVGVGLLEEISAAVQNLALNVLASRLA